MRWITPIESDERTRTWFALFPVHVYNSRQTRWLEIVTVRQQYSYGFWNNVEFIDWDQGSGCTNQ